MPSVADDVCPRHACSGGGHATCGPILGVGVGGVTSDYACCLLVHQSLAAVERASLVPGTVLSVRAVMTSGVTTPVTPDLRPSDQEAVPVTD